MSRLKVKLTRLTLASYGLPFAGFNCSVASGSVNAFGLPPAVNQKRPQQGPNLALPVTHLPLAAERGLLAVSIRWAKHINPARIASVGMVYA